MAKLDVLHAALIETARRSHPTRGTRSPQLAGMRCLRIPSSRRPVTKSSMQVEKLFGGNSNPSPSDYEAAGYLWSLS